MTMEHIQSLFAGLFAPPALDALAPVLALGAGVLLCILADILPGARALRPALVLGSLAVAAWFELELLLAPGEIGPVVQGSFAATRASSAFGLLLIGAGVFAWLASARHYEREAAGVLKGEHDALLLSSVAGMLLMAGARDLILFFIGLELLSIPLYALAALRRGRAASVEAGLKYFLLGAFASALFLYGAALVYAATGSTSLDELRQIGARGPLALCGVALLASSVFFKLSVFPFHLWVPDVYQGSPTPVTLLMATGTKAAGFAFLLNASFLLPANSASLVAIAALITIALGNLGALAQTDLKRMLAYSGIAHAGTMLLAIAGSLAGDPDAQGAQRAVLFYLLAYVFSAAGAFGALALLEADGERFTRLDSLRGLGRSRPRLALALSLFLLSMGGIPGAGGFWGKWFVFEVLVRADMTGYAIAGALLSLVAFGYYLRVIVALWMEEAPVGAAEPRTLRPWTAGLAAVACSAGVVLTGIWPGLFLEHL